MRTIAALLFAAHVAVGAQDFDIRQYGATGNGTAMDTAAIQKAIDAAAAAGGGTVVFPPGTYLSGSVYLKSHVKLQLDLGATLLGSPRRADYRKLHFYGLLLANNQEDIGIFGKGVINGQGKILAADAPGPMMGAGIPYAREGERPVLISFLNCRNVTVRDITLKESACWVQVYRDCENVTLENLTVRTMSAVTNDGLDIDGCSHVVVRGCDIDSEDDGICLKSSRKACDDILVENCRVRSSCNALKFGTASAGGFKNITIRNLEIYDTYLSAIALESVDGGALENVNISKIKITDTNNALFIRLGHRNVNGPVGSLRGVTISDVTAEIPNRPREQMNKFPPGWRHMCNTLITASITGLPGNPVRDVTLRNISILYGGIGSTPKPDHHRIDNLDNVPECAEQYPESKMFGTLPAWGFYCRHAEGIKFENVTLRVKGKDYRPALVCDDVKDILLDGFRVQSAGSEPVIVLKDVQGATIRNSPTPPGTRRFVEKMGTTQEVRGP